MIAKYFYFLWPTVSRTSLLGETYQNETISLNYDCICKLLLVKNNTSEGVLNEAFVFQNYTFFFLLFSDMGNNFFSNWHSHCIIVHCFSEINFT